MPVLTSKGKRLTVGGSYLTIPATPADTSFKLEITTTYDYQQIVLPHYYTGAGYNYNYVVDYGDGTILSITSSQDPNCLHTYTTTGVYILKIQGICETFKVDWNSMYDVITKVILWGNVGLLQLNFMGCQLLTEVPSDTLGGLSLVTDFTQCFYYCTTLSTISSGLFQHATNATSFEYTFYNCTSLTSIPSGLFDNCTSVIDFQYTFYYCTSLTGLAPELWLRVPEPNGSYCFTHDTSLSNFTVIPVLWGGLGLSGFTIFTKPDYANWNTVHDDITDEVHITRKNSQPIFNIVYEAGWDVTGETSPYDTEWNNDGWSDLTNLGTRTYNTFISTAGYNPVSLIGQELIMHIISEGRYFLIKFISWTQGNMGGGFSYGRKEYVIDKSLILELTTTSPNKSVTVPHLSGYTYNYVIDYGDGSPLGTVTTYNGTGATHTYVTPGEYTMKITGTCETISTAVGDGSLESVLVEITSWGKTGAKRLVFNNCSLLTTIPNDSLIGLSLVTDFSYFMSNTSLTTIPSGLFVNATGVTTFEKAFQNCVTLTGQAPSLWFRSPEPIGTDCFSGDTSLANYSYIPVSWGGLGLDATLVLELATTYPNQEITIPHLDGYTYNYTVDYGDGTVLTVTSYSDPNATHTYVDISGYTLKISGTCQTIYTNNSGTLIPTLTSISQWGYVGLLSVNFSGCLNLISISNNSAGISSVIDFSGTFYGCTSLTGVTSGLFDKCVNTTSFNQTFRSCSSLTNIPSDLFKYNIGVNNFNYTFADCSSLMVIPTDLFKYNTNVTDFNYTFSNCSSMTGITSDLFRYNTEVVNFNGVFQNTNITTIPTDVFRYNTKVLNFAYTFYNIPMTSVPSGLFDYNVNVVNFNYTFGSDQYLTTIPSGLFDNCTGVTDFSYTFAGSLPLTTIPTDLFKHNTLVTTFAYTFYYCQKISAIPVDLFRYNTLVTIFGNTFHECESLTSIPSGLFDYNPLVIDFGGTFVHCTGITSIPSGLFDNCPNVTNFFSVFNDCKSITSIPSGLFNYNVNVTDMGGLFYNCGKITSIPNNLFDNNTLVTSFYSTFYFCHKISSIPTNLFKYNVNVNQINGIFNNCESLTTIPSDLFHNFSTVTNFNQIFQNCTGLTSIPLGLFNNCSNATSFVYAFYGCTSLLGLAPHLWFDYPSATSTQCFTNDTGLTNYTNIPTAWGGGGGAGAEFQLSITTTNPSQVVTIPTTASGPSYNYDYVVDWGDGSSTSHVTSYNDSNRIHTYASASGYTIKIKGLCQTFYVDSGNTLTTLLKKILAWGDVGLKKLVLAYCAGLTSVPNDTLSALSSLTDLNNSFFACPSLSTVPSNVFKYCDKVSTVNGTFYGCHSLTGITAGLFNGCVKLLTVSQTFADCGNITFIPNDLFRYNTEINTFNYIFQSCTGITSIPVDFFRYNTKVTNFANVFWACEKLTTIPTDLFRYNVNVTAFNQAFYDCRSLTGITVGLFDYNVNVTDFGSVFNGCTGLTSIPSTLFDNCTGVTTFQNSFYGCGTTLTGNAPTLWTSHPSATGTQCFYGDTNLTNYASIPVGWK